MWKKILKAVGKAAVTFAPNLVQAILDALAKKQQKTPGEGA